MHLRWEGCTFTFSQLTNCISWVEMKSFHVSIETLATGVWWLNYLTIKNHIYYKLALIKMLKRISMSINIFFQRKRTRDYHLSNELGHAEFEYLSISYFSTRSECDASFVFNSQRFSSVYMKFEQAFETKTECV